MMILSFVVTCLVSLRALRLRTLVIHSIIVIHSSPHCVDARFALASLALLIECAQFVSCTPCPHCVDARLRCSATCGATDVREGMQHVRGKPKVTIVCFNHSNLEIK